MLNGARQNMAAAAAWSWPPPARRPGHPVRRAARLRRRRRHPLGVDGDGAYNGTIDGDFVWGRGKLEAVRAWAERHGVDLARQLGLQRQLLRRPAARRRRPPDRRQPRPPPSSPLARRLAARHFDLPDGVLKIAGRLELQECWRRLRAARAAAQRAPRHRRRREHPARRAGHRRVQPPQLLRPGRRHGAGQPGPGRSASSARRRSSTPRSSGSCPGHGRHPGRPLDRDRTSRSRPSAALAAGEAVASCPRARSPAARRSSTPC